MASIGQDLLDLINLHVLVLIKQWTRQDVLIVKKHTKPLKSDPGYL